MRCPWKNNTKQRQCWLFSCVVDGMHLFNCVLVLRTHCFKSKVLKINCLTVNSENEFYSGGQNQSPITTLLTQTIKIHQGIRIIIIIPEFGVRNYGTRNSSIFCFHFPIAIIIFRPFLLHSGLFVLLFGLWTSAYFPINLSFLNAKNHSSSLACLNRSSVDLIPGLEPHILQEKTNKCYLISHATSTTLQAPLEER